MTKNVDVIIAEDVMGPALDALAADYCVVSDPDLWAHRQDLKRYLGTARALVVRNRTQVDAELMQAAPVLRVIARAGVGLDNIDLQLAAARGICVVAPRGANAVSVAEYSVGAAINLVRGLAVHDRGTKSGGWNRSAGRELSGGTWGVLGVGSTGTAVARLARSIGMSVLGYDPYLADQTACAAAGVVLVSLDEVCRQSDVVSVHLPGTVETAGLLDDRFFSHMRPGAILISAGRGDVVDERALLSALLEGRIAGAALDVRSAEPPPIGALETLENVLLTPHIAGITVESQERITQALASDIRSVLVGGVPCHAVSFEAIGGAG